jgi:hypothetical protein
MARAARRGGSGRSPLYTCIRDTFPSHQNNNDCNNY